MTTTRKETALPEVHRASWRHDLGAERAGPRVHLHLHVAATLMAGERILIVEDNEKKNRKLERDILQFHGYRTAEADTAEEGIRLAQAPRKRTPSAAH
jgi:hypothetical protein